jgi:CBS domain-containing protein
LRHRIVRTIVEGQALRTLPVDATVRTAARFMAAHQIGSIPVTHEDGTLLGIFTERDTVNRVLAKDLSPDTTVLGAVMTANPEVIQADERAMDALRKMHDGGFRHLPVMDRGRLVGVLSIRDFLGTELQSIEDELDKRRQIIEG